MNAPSQSESRALTAAAQPQFTLQPRSFDEAWNLATMVANTDMAPKDYQGKPERCMVAIQWGDEVGLKPLQSLQNIAVVNGRPSMWGDAMLAIVRSSPLCEYFIEEWEGSGNSLKAVCRTKRRGEPKEQVREFSMDDAQKADLLGKDTYKKYGKRMLQMRARAWLIRDVYTDLIRGLHMAEEAMDMPPPEKFMGPAEVVQPTSAPAPAPTAAPVPAPTAAPAPAAGTTLQHWSDAELAKREAKIAEFYGKGKTSDEIIAFYSQKGVLSDAQKKRIADLKPKAEATTSASAAPAADQAQDVTPKVTYAQVADAMNKAEDTEQLATAAAQIAAVADAQQRAELTAIYERRAEELPF